MFITCRNLIFCIKELSNHIGVMMSTSRVGGFTSGVLFSDPSNGRNRPTVDLLEKVIPAAYACKPCDDDDDGNGGNENDKNAGRNNLGNKFTSDVDDVDIYGSNTMNVSCG